MAYFMCVLFFSLSSSSLCWFVFVERIISIAIWPRAISILSTFHMANWYSTFIHIGGMPLLFWYVSRLIWRLRDVSELCVCVLCVDCQNESELKARCSCIVCCSREFRLKQSHIMYVYRRPQPILGAIWLHLDMLSTHVIMVWWLLSRSDTLFVWYGAVWTTECDIY